MKKYIVALIFVLTLILLQTTTSLAYDVPITKSNLQEAFNTWAKGGSGATKYFIDGAPVIWSIDPSTPIIVKDTQLEAQENNKTIYINYDLSNNPTFYIEKTINSNTTIEELQEIKKTITEVSNGIIGTYIVQGVPIGVAYSESEALKLDIDTSETFKYSSKKSGSTLTIEKNGKKYNFEEGNIDISEYVDIAYGKDILLNDKNNIYTYSLKKNKNSNTSYTIKSELIINKNADFSKLLGKSGANTKNENEIPDSQSSKNSDKSDLKEQQISSSNVIAEKDDPTVSPKPIPQTGVSETIAIILIIILIALVVLRKILSKYKEI